MILKDDVELIVVDDSYTPLSEQTLAQIPERLCYIHRGERLGVSSARNIGAKKAKGEYLIFFDDDDDFTSDWLLDFYKSVDQKKDLVFCNMKMLKSNGQIISTSLAKRKKNDIVIPGAWMIRQNIFLDVGGFDERLKFAENTELFFRLDQIPLEKLYLKNENFIYRQSPNGGSKNLQNMLDSIRVILNKHDGYLNNHIKHLYHQNLGVIELRMSNFKEAKKHLFKSWIYKPYKIKTLARFGLSYFPFLSKKIYSLDFQDT